MKGIFTMNNKIKLNRNYLTSEEIAYISNEMINANSGFERIMIKWGIVGQFLYDFGEDFKVTDDTTTNDIYNYMVSNGVDIMRDVENIYHLDNIVDVELGTTKTIEKVLNEIVDRLNESMKNVDPKELIVELNKINNK